MRHIILLTVFVLTSIIVAGQGQTDTLGGEVTYMTSQSIYVRFPSTQDVQPGDTLYALLDQQLIPALIIRHTSSTSIVGDPIGDIVPEKGDRFFLKRQPAPATEQPEPREKMVAPPVVVVPEEDEQHEAEEEIQTRQVQADKLKGRISAASYIYFSDQEGYDRQRMRYTVSLNANRLADSKLSLETYMSFRHTLNEWQEVRDDFYRAFKVYSLAAQYEISDSWKVWAGRKINFSMSNVGAIDGIQTEKKWDQLTTGIFAGFRPDHTNYSFNANLLQFGAYIGHAFEAKKGTIQSTVAFAEQRNHGMTDRRFAYVQHINSAIPRVNIFTSFEFDLFTIENATPRAQFDITSIYFSLRYKVSDKLSVFGSYDARKNIIYYETYKSFIDQLLEDETRQGLRFTFNYRPIKGFTIGSSAGYRFQKDNPNASKNLHTYLTASRIPAIKASGTLSLTMIENAYLKGLIYGARISRDVIKGKLYGEIQYKIFNHQYIHSEAPIRQSLAGLSLNWRMTKKVSLSANYEGEIQNKKIFHRIYTNIIHRL